MKNRLKKITATGDGGWILLGGLGSAIAAIAGVLSIALAMVCFFLVVAM